MIAYLYAITDRPDVPLCRSAEPLALPAKPAVVAPASRKHELAGV